MKLKQCPFCGGEPILKVYKEEGYLRLSHKWAVQCEYTGTETGCGAEGQQNKIKELAIEAWNQRTKII